MLIKHNFSFYETHLHCIFVFHFTEPVGSGVVNTAYISDSVPSAKNSILVEDHDEDGIPTEVLFYVTRINNLSFILALKFYILHL